MFSWSFSRQKNRSPMWYITWIIIVGFLLVYGIVTQLYLLSVVAVLFSGTYLLIENNSSEINQVFIDEKFLKINTTEFVWQDFDTFHIIEVKGSPLFLRMIPKKRLSGAIDVPFVEGLDVPLLYEFLLSIFPEGKTMEISNTDTLIYMSKM